MTSTFVVELQAVADPSAAALLCKSQWRYLASGILNRGTFFFKLQPLRLGLLELTLSIRYPRARIVEGRAVTLVESGIGELRGERLDLGFEFGDFHRQRRKRMLFLERKF